MWPIIKNNISQRKWSIFWWAIGISAFIVLELSVYSTVKSQAAELNQALDRLPDSIKSFFGASTDLFSPVGYLSSRLFYLLLPLMLTVLSIGLGSSLLAREESEGTIELLMSRSVSRYQILVSKFVGMITITGIVGTISTLVVLLCVKIFGVSVPLSYVAFCSLFALILSLLIGALAFFVTAIKSKSRGMAIAFASFVGLGGYIIGSLEKDVSWLHWPAKIFPYHYYNPTHILEGNYDFLPMVWFSLVIIAIFALSLTIFRKRDLGQ